MTMSLPQIRNIFGKVFGTMRGLTVLLLSILVLVANAWGQTAQTGAIRGTVSDPQKGVIAGATVTATNQATNASAPPVTTNDLGVYIVSQLTPGIYAVQITAPGFKTTTKKDVKVRATEITPVSVALEVGEVATTVEVAAEAATPVQTENPTTGATIDANEIVGAPLPKRNYLDLLALSAGTNGGLGGAVGLGKGNPVVNVNGQRAGQNNYTIDGMNANDFNLPILTNVPVPTPDAIAEFKVQTSMYDATFGRNGGGNINAVMKSGTKSLHGSAFEYYRDTALNANDWFLNRGQNLDASGKAVRPTLHLHTFGGSVGGPIPIAENFFFFGSYQRTKEKNGQDVGGLISTSLPSALSNDRSAATLLNTLFTPLQRTQLQNAGIGLDPVAVNLLNLRTNLYGPNSFLIPTPGTGGVFTISSADAYTENQFVTNLDKQFTDSHRLSGRWFFSNSTSLLPFGSNSARGLGFQENLPINNRFLSITDQYMFSPTMVNEARFGYNRIFFARTPNPPITVGQVGSSHPNGPSTALWNFTFAGVSVGANSNSDRGTTDNTFLWSDTFSWLRGKHSLRFGGEVNRYQLNRFNRFGQFGTVNFLGNVPLRNRAGTILFFDSAGNVVPPPADPNDPNAPRQLRLSNLQNFLIGFPSSTTVNIGDPTGMFRLTDASFFVQDDYKFNPRMTVNLGVRWDVFGVSHDKRGKLVNFDYATGQFLIPASLNTQLFPGITPTAGMSDTTLIHNHDRWNLAPRIGFAYDVFGNSKTALRGGFGVFYQRTSNQPLLQISLSNPFRQTYAASPSDTARQLVPGSLSNPFPNFQRTTTLSNPTLPIVTDITCDPNGPSGVGCLTLSGGGLVLNPAIDRKLRAPYTYQYNLTLQQQLPFAFLAEVGYVGARGRRLIHINPDADFPATTSPSNPFLVRATNGQTALITRNTAANFRARTLYPGLAHDGNNYFVNNEGESYYNSAQFTLLRRFRDMYLQGAYTYSRSIDTSSGNERDPLAPSELDQGATNNPRNLRLGRGLSDFDRTHIFRFSMDYSLPFSVQGGLKWLLNGWGFNTIITYQSGLPLYIIDGDACSIYGPAPTCTPNFAPAFNRNNAFVGGDPRTHTISTNPYLNPNAFVSPPAPSSLPNETGFGVVGRNIFRAPRQQNWDFSIRKRTPVYGEGRSFEIAFNLFNLFNHPSFDVPANNQGVTFNANDISLGSTFGVITRTVTNPRIIQIVGRFNF